MDLAHYFFDRCLEANVTPYVVTKKTVFKWQEGYWETMKSVFDTNVRKRQEKIYREAQRFKLAFSRFVHMVKLKVKKKHNYVNLVFQPFHKKPLYICDNNRVYSFEDLELYHMVQSCFNYETYDIPTILHLKNLCKNLPNLSLHIICKT